MIVCPVCEHPQAQGSECEVCGKRLVAGPSAADLAIPVVEGLEPTLHAPIDAPPEPAVDLEPTLHRATAAIPVDRTPDLEATRAAPVDVLEVAAVPDVERTSAGIPGDAPTALPAFVTCRYCRTPAMPGEKLCSRCGMKLPVLSEAPRAGAAPEQRVCTCGTVVRPDASLCPSCGARLR